MIGALKKRRIEQAGERHFHPAFGDAPFCGCSRCWAFAFDVHEHSGGLQMRVPRFVGVVDSRSRGKPPVPAARREPGAGASESLSLGRVLAWSSSRRARYLDVLLGKMLLVFEHVSDCSPGPSHTSTASARRPAQSDLGARQPRQQKFAREGLDVDGHMLSITRY